MDKLFLTILNMSLTGAFIIAVICLVRLPLRKVPKMISYCLWAVAGFRLVFPFTIESVWSLIPFGATPIPTNIATQPVLSTEGGISAMENTINGTTQGVQSALLPAVTNGGAAEIGMLATDVSPLQNLTTVAAVVWLAGIILMLVYAVISYLILANKMRNAVLLDANIYEADAVRTPFVLGVFAPKIYLPPDLTESVRHYIILHEQTHIRRRDHIVKFAAYIVLSLHWFNPPCHADRQVCKNYIVFPMCPMYNVASNRIICGRGVCI